MTCVGSENWGGVNRDSTVDKAGWIRHKLITGQDCSKLGVVGAVAIHLRRQQPHGDDADHNQTNQTIRTSRPFLIVRLLLNEDGLMS